MALGLVLGDRPSEADDDVAADEVLLVGRDDVVTLDPRDGRRSAGGRAGVGVPREERAAEREVRQRAIAVARLDELGGRLAAEPGDLLIGERRLAEETCDQLDERLDVPADHLAVQADGRRTDVERELGPEPVDRRLDLLRRHPVGAATKHAGGKATDAVLALGVGERAAPHGHDQRDERDRGGALHESDCATIEIEPGRHAPASSETGDASVSGSGWTRTIVRASSTK